MSWYMDLVTHRASYGIFISTWNTVIRNSCMDAKGDNAATGSQKHDQRHTTKQVI